MACRAVQHRHTVWWADVGQRGLGLEHGDHRLLAAGHHGVLEAAEAKVKRVRARAARLFLRDDHRDDLVVAAFLGDGVRAGRVAVGPDAGARVCSGLEQQPRHLDVALHDRDVEGAYFEASRSPAHQIDDFRPPREKPTSRAEVAFLHGLVQPGGRNAIDRRLQLRPALEPVRARQHELRVVQREGLRRRGAMVGGNLDDRVW